MHKHEHEMKIGDWIVGFIVFLPSILTISFLLTILIGLLVALIKLITFWF